MPVLHATHFLVFMNQPTHGEFWNRPAAFQGTKAHIPRLCLGVHFHCPCKVDRGTWDKPWESWNSRWWAPSWKPKTERTSDGTPYSHTTPIRNSNSVGRLWEMKVPSRVPQKKPWKLWIPWIWIHYNHCNPMRLRLSWLHGDIIEISWGYHHPRHESTRCHPSNPQSRWSARWLRRSGRSRANRGLWPAGDQYIHIQICNTAANDIMNIYIYICYTIYSSTYIYIYSSTCMYIYIYSSTCVYIYICLYIYTVCSRVYIYICTL